MNLKVDIKEACQLKRACFEMIMKYEGLKVQADGEVREMYIKKEREWIKLYDKLQDQIDKFDEEHGGKDGEEETL
jgi:hypothetical protein